MPHELIVEWNGSEWRCDLHDEEHRVVVTPTLREMEEELDYLEATGRLGGNHAGTQPSRW
jgi:hypothetical protein